MTVQEFCMTQTKVWELCVIRDSGYIVEPVWIDHEDTFVIPDKYINKEVINSEWGTIPVLTEHGDKLYIPCCYLDV